MHSKKTYSQIAIKGFEKTISAQDKIIKKLIFQRNISIALAILFLLIILQKI